MLQEPFSASAKYSFNLHIVASNCCRSICKQKNTRRIDYWIIAEQLHLEFMMMLSLHGPLALVGIVSEIWPMSHHCNLSERTLSCKWAAVLECLVVSLWLNTFRYYNVKTNKHEMLGSFDYIGKIINCCIENTTAIPYGRTNFTSGITITIIPDDVLMCKRRKFVNVFFFFRP